MTQSNNPKWAELLRRAVNEPGVISQAYSRFHNYSVGNQMLAMFQCQDRGIAPGPIGSFMHWKENGRNVIKGEKAIALCMPVTIKKSKKSEDPDAPTKDGSFTMFVLRNNWFVLSQTEGEEYKAPETPGWDAGKALAALDIKRVDFSLMDGNTQGYAIARNVAVSEVADLPYKTLFHEIAHVVLGHTSEGQLNDGAEKTPRDIRELEAESVAMLCCESLGLPGAEFSRGYIQSWFRGNEVPERSAQKIFNAADKILKAGREEVQ